MTDISNEDRELLHDMSDRASTLYWNSDRSVNSIANDLGLSKGRLYELIRPMGSGDDCPKCQSELVFANRTSHDNRRTTCPVCDLGGVTIESVRTAARRFSEMAEAEARGDDDTREDPNLDEMVNAIGPSVLGPDALGVVAGLLVGGVVGILIGRYFRR